MKRLLVLTILLLLPVLALADGKINLDENAVFEKMPCSWVQGYEPTITGNTLTVHIPLTADDVVGAIKAELYTEDTQLSPLKTQGASTTVYRNGSSYTATLRAELLKGRVNGDYPCMLLFTGKDGTGNEVHGEYRFTLHIRDGRKPEETIRPVIAEVNADFSVGEDSTLTAVIKNPSRYADITGLTLRVTDASGDILPAGTDVMLLPDMKAGSTQTVSLPLKVKANAAVSLHTLKFDLNWTALDAAGTWTENYTLPVRQTIRLEQGGVQLANTILQGEMTALTVPVMNMGRADLQNIMVTLTLPGITDRQSVLVGTLTPGETKSAKLTFIPGASTLGLHQGTLTITGEDIYGNTAAITLPVETTVEKPVTVAATADSEPEKEASAPLWLVITLGAGCVVLLVVCIIQGGVLRRKIRRLEEDRL